MVDHQWIVAFEGQHCTISDYNLPSPRTLARGVQKGGLYRMLVDLMALVHYSEKWDEPSIFEEACVEHAWLDAMDTGSKHIVESVIDFRLATDRSVVKMQSC
jgi:hypothetical protein